MDYWSYGDVQELDAISAGFDLSVKAANQDLLKETAQAVEHLEKTGIAFPYDPVLEQNVRMMLQVIFGMLAQRWGPHWIMSEEDAQKMSIALAQVVQHYMPEFERIGPAGNLAIVAGSIVGPRLMLNVLQKYFPAQESPSSEEKETIDNDAA